jgi:hypothetical protein
MLPHLEFIQWKCSWLNICNFEDAMNQFEVNKIQRHKYPVIFIPYTYYNFLNGNTDSSICPICKLFSEVAEPYTRYYKPFDDSSVYLTICNQDKTTDLLWFYGATNEVKTVMMAIWPHGVQHGKFSDDIIELIETNTGHNAIMIVVAPSDHIYKGGMRDYFDIVYEDFNCYRNFTTSVRNLSHVHL